MGEFDKNQIGQVVDNIVINAQQAMPDGGEITITAANIRLSTDGHTTLPAGNYVKIAFIDRGIGIPAEILHRIFDPFFTTKAKGHGLGLATCYSIVKRHGGSIEVVSEPGKGSTFTILLPAADGSVNTSAASKAPVHKGSGTFLIMDDEDVMLETVGGMLTLFGYSVLCAADGDEAVDLFRKELSAGRQVAGMIFDLTIPGGMGGREAIDVIRSIDRAVPVFVASGYADDPVMAQPQDHGFTASISKPFMRQELANLLNRWMMSAGDTSKPAANR
jgi:CheY-like chemotaxis protein